MNAEIERGVCGSASAISRNHRHGTTTEPQVTNPSRSRNPRFGAHRLIVQACDESLAGQHRDMFPLHVWMTHDLIRARGSVTASFGKRAFLVRAIPCPAMFEQRHKIIHDGVALGSPARAKARMPSRVAVRPRVGR